MRCDPSIFRSPLVSPDSRASRDVRRLLHRARLPIVSAVRHLKTEARMSRGGEEKLCQLF